MGVDCLCGNVVQGFVDPCQPFSTRAGSFWSADTMALDTSRLGFGCPVRGTCITHGYRSLAVIPVKMPSGEIVGTIQCNSKTPGKFDPDQIELLEAIADVVGIRV
jgi:GAF domain-containing protein